MLLKPLSMTLPSRLRTGPLTAAAMRRTEASVSSFCSWQFEQRRFVGPRVRSLKRWAPKRARRLMWLGLTLVQGFKSGSVDVGFSRRKRSQGVSSETSVAS